MKYYITLLVLTISIASCKSKATQTQSVKETTTTASQVYKQSWYNSEALLAHVKELSSDAYQGRRTGTPGAEKAKTYIIEQLTKQDVKPLGDNYAQDFEVTFKGEKRIGRNILGVVKGSEFTNKYIVLSAHYDHEGVKNGKIYNGADDDASGISALIAFAEYFKTHPPKHSVIIAAFDAEEIGLLGAKYFVDNSIIPQEDIVLNINMDMVSRSDANELFMVGTRYTPSLKQALSTFTPKADIKVTIAHDGSDGKADWTQASDHAPFHNANIPFLYFGVADHKDYHKPTDDYENIHPKFYQNAVTTIIEVFSVLDNLDKL